MYAHKGVSDYRISFRPKKDIRDVFIHPVGLGLRGGEVGRCLNPNLTLIYCNRILSDCQPFPQICNVILGSGIAGFTVVTQ